MKKIDLSGITASAGYPLLANNANALTGLDFIQSLIGDIVTRFGSNMTPASGNAIILNGLAITGSAISAGAMYYTVGGNAGEIFIYNGGTVSGSPTSHIATFISNNPTDASPYQTKLSDGSLVSIHNQRTIYFAYAASANTGDLPDYNSFTGSQITLNTSAIATIESEIAPLIAPAWTYITGGIGYSPSWGDTGSPFNNGRYRIEGKYVVLSGNITGGTSATAAFTLPVGYRPLNRCDFETGCTGSSFYSGLVTVQASGVCTFYWPSGGQNNSMEGIRIPLD